MNFFFPLKKNDKYNLNKLVLYEAPSGKITENSSTSLIIALRQPADLLKSGFRIFPFLSRTLNLAS